MLRARQLSQDQRKPSLQPWLLQPRVVDAVLHGYGFAEGLRLYQTTLKLWIEQPKNQPKYYAGNHVPHDMLLDGHG
jgi:hypothetical protein